MSMGYRRMEHANRVTTSQEALLRRIAGSPFHYTYPDQIEGREKPSLRSLTRRGMLKLGHFTEDAGFFYAMSRGREVVMLTDAGWALLGVLDLGVKSNQRRT